MSVFSASLNPVASTCDRVMSDVEVGDDILTGVVAGHVASKSGFGVYDGDLNAGNGCPRGVGDRSDDGCFLCRCDNRKGKEKRTKNKEME